MENKIILTNKKIDRSYIGWTIFGIIFLIGIVLQSFSNQSIPVLLLLGLICVFVFLIALSKYVNRYKEIDILKLDYYRFILFKEGKEYKSYNTIEIERFEEVDEKNNSIKVVLNNEIESSNIIILEQINNKLFVQRANELLKKYEEERNQIGEIQSGEYANIKRSINVLNRLDHMEEFYLMFLGKVSILKENNFGKYVIKEKSKYVFLTKDYEIVYFDTKGLDTSIDSLCNNKYFIVKKESEGGKIIFNEVKFNTFDPIKVNEIKTNLEKYQKIIYSPKSIKEEVKIEKKLVRSFIFLSIDGLLSFIVPEIVASSLNPKYPDNRVVWGVLLGMVLGGCILEVLYINYLRMRAIKANEEGEK